MAQVEKTKLSIIVPAHNAENELPVLFDSLEAQISADLEVIVVDDCSEDNTYRVAASFNCVPIRLSENRGPATCRNIGARMAKGDILVFTDSDCKVPERWIERIGTCFLHNDIHAVMGKVVLEASNFLGNSISALGFPAGGSVGFDKIWRVNKEGFTESLSTCNCAIRRDAFEKVGGFDESFPFPGGEDSLLAYHLTQRHYNIKYCDDVVVYHAARSSFRNFVKWQFRRGVSSYIFSKKVSNKKGFLSLRIWSTKNIFRACLHQNIFPMVAFLFLTSFFVQFLGFVSAKKRDLK